MIDRLTGSVPWLLLAAATLAVVTGDSYLLTVGTLIGTWALLAVGLNLLMGYTGLIHLGIGAFYALGAYGVAVLTLEHGVNPWLCLLLMPVVAFVVGALIGPAFLRTRGLHFAVATLGMGIIISDVIGNWIPVTNGPLGIAGIQRPAPLRLGGLEVDLTDEATFFLFVVLVLVLGIALGQAYHRSRVARILVAARDDELLAQSLGFSALRYRVFAFAATSAFAAFAGVVYAWFIRYISPAPFTFFELSFQVFVLVAVGGAGSVWGPVVGAVVLTGIPEVLELDAHLKVIVYGIVLLMVIAAMPKGIVPSLGALRRRLPTPGRARRAETPA